MRSMVITDDATRRDLEEAIVHLRAKQKRCVIQSTRDEIGEEIDELLDMRAKAPT